jgi:adenosylmethionine-8-amino-7-oxononanoate aminotransferase
VFRATLRKLLDLPIVGDVRGEGFFFGIELVKDKTTKETFDDEESERLLRGSCPVRSTRAACTAAPTTAATR